MPLSPNVSEVSFVVVEWAYPRATCTIPSFAGQILATMVSPVDGDLCRIIVCPFRSIVHAFGSF